MDIRDALRSALEAHGEGQRALLARLSSAFSSDPQLVAVSTSASGRPRQPARRADPGSLVQALFPTIAAVVTDGRDPQPVQWAAGVVEQALRPLDARPARADFLRRGLARTAPLTLLPPTPVAPQSVGAIGRLLASSDHKLEKVGLECFANVYPFLFKQACVAELGHSYERMLTRSEPTAGARGTSSTCGRMSSRSRRARSVSGAPAAPAPRRLRSRSSSASFRRRPECLRTQGCARRERAGYRASHD